MFVGNKIRTPSVAVGQQPKHRAQPSVDGTRHQVLELHICPRRIGEHVLGRQPRYLLRSVPARFDNVRHVHRHVYRHVYGHVCADMCIDMPHDLLRWLP